MSSRRRTALVVAICALGLPAAATADWSGAEDISSRGNAHEDVNVAVSADGSAEAVWVREFRVSTLNERTAVQARHYAADGTPGPIRTLSGSVDGGDPDESSPAVAIDDHGRSVIVWERGDVIQLVRLEPDGLPSGDGIVTVPTTGEVSEPDVDVTPDGAAVVTWQRFEDETNDVRAIDASPVPEGTSFPLPAVEVVSLTDVDSDNGDFFQFPEGPQIATAPNGDSVITWLKFECQCSGSPQSLFTYQARRMESDGTLGTVHDLYPEGPANTEMEPEVAMDDNGNASVVYTNPEFPPDPQARVRRVLANDTLGPERVLTNPATTLVSAFSLDVDVAPTGEATVIWFDCGAGCASDTGRYARLAADGTVSTPATQFTEADQPAQIALGVDDSNNAYLFWNTEDFTSARGHARRLTAAGTLEPTQTFPESETTVWQELTADAGGAVALGAWVIEDPETADFEDPFVQGAFFRPAPSPPPPPPPPPTNNPSANPPDDVAAKQQRCETLQRKLRNTDKKYRRKALKRKLRRLGC